MQKVRIGIVGLGRLGMKHAENIAVRTAGAELAAACALEPERVRHAREAWGVPEGYARFEAMLENDSLDAIFIAPSSAEHCRARDHRARRRAGHEGGLRGNPVVPPR